MSAYIKLSTLEYPRHEGDIRLEHPEILESQTGDTFPCPDTYQLVQWVDAPTITEHQQAYEIAPIQQDGVWIMRWEVRDLTAAEIEHLQTVNIRNSVTVERI
tara:strand:+ start:1674 stop:1979 length:306 start_codon:yes stop_codon:yes gene_type:complete